MKNNAENNIIEKTRAALLKLFPEQADEKEKTAEDVIEAKEKKEDMRGSGLLLTEHGKCGTALDALCEHDQVVVAARIMDAEGFFLESITGVDWIKDNRLEIIYDYNQYGLKQCRVVVRTTVDRDDPHLPSISGIFPAADWHERETHDFYGIKFQGHPGLIPILLPEDADFHPLLKDFKP